MKYNQQTIGGLFSGKIQFQIPVYQRAYAWDKSNWKTFLEDIQESSRHDNNYSYGSILLKTIEQDVKYDIIDGQQRITTLILFMRAMINTLRKRAESDEIKELIEDITEGYLVRKSKLRLMVVEYDRDCFNAVVVDNRSSYTANSPSQIQLIEAIRYFEKELEVLSIKELQLICQTINRSDITRIELDGEKEAALMFELQNNRGKDLTNLERLKSYFMYQMYVYSDEECTENNIDALSQTFKEIYRIVNDIKLKGLNEDSILIYHCNAYLDCAFGYRNLTNIKDELKKSNDKVSWMKNFVQELKNSFEAIKKHQLNNTNYRNKLFKLEAGVYIYPFIIKGYKHCDVAEMDEVYKILEIVAFRDKLVHSRADLSSRLSVAIKTFNGDINTLKSNIKDIFENEWHWADKRIIDQLNGYMYGHDILKYLLWEYEESIQNKGYKTGSCELENEQIEHISPQTPPERESIALGYDVLDDGQYSEEFVADCLNCIGNLMLISGSHNASIGNKAFADKLASYKGNPLLNQQAEIASFLDNDKIEWKTSQIKKRQKTIVDFAIRRWSL